VNSNVSKQWFCDRYCINAARVHGGGAAFDRTSCNVGLRGQYGPAGIDKLSGREGKNSPEDMKPSSSASQSERTDEHRGDDSADEIFSCNEGGFRDLDLLIAIRRYFMCTPRMMPSLSVCPYVRIQYENAMHVALYIERRLESATDCYRVEHIGRRKIRYVYRDGVANEKVTVCYEASRSRAPLKT